jgi:signal transduction histidine kinase
MLSLEDVIVALALWCGFSKPTIFLLTGITSGILALIILCLRWVVLLEERWARYFGWAFAVFGIQYVIQAPAAWMQTYGSVSHADWVQILKVAALSSQAIFSPINNLCFLGAAQALLAYQKPLSWRWAVVAFVTSLYAMGPNTFKYRLPEALFSVFCLGYLGVAMFRNFSPRRRPLLASTILIGAFLYGALNVVYSLNPVMAKTKIGSALASGITDLKRSELIPVASSLSPLGSLDALVFAVAFVLKLLLFLGALLLIVKILLMLSPKVARRFFMDVRAKRTEYLETDGILRALGQSVEADFAALYIHLPSHRAPEVSQRQWLWPASASGKQNVLSRFLPGGEYWQTDAAAHRVNAQQPHPDRQEAIRRLPFPPENTVLGRVLRTGDEVSTHDLRSYLATNRLSHNIPGDNRAVAVVPIYYQGAVIGCLDVGWHEPLGYSATALQTIRHAADWLAPAVHTRRQLVAVDRLTERLQSLEIAQTDAAGRAGGLGSLITEVHDILSPIETSCHIDFGFRGDRVVCSDSGLVFPAPGIAASQASGELVARSADLTVKNPTAGEDVARGLLVPVGEVVFSLAKRRDPTARPALAADDLHRRIVASLVTGAVFDLARLDLGSIHNRLQLDLNSKALVSIPHWFEAVRKAALNAGLAWAVAQLPEQEPVLLGNDEECELASSLASDPHTAYESLLIPLPEPRRGAWHVLRLPLAEMRGCLWLGVARQNFGVELELPSPWRTFVHSLAMSADSALVRIERQRGQRQTKRLQVVAIEVEMTRLLMHKLRNVTVMFAGGVQRLEDTLPEIGSPVTVALHESVHRLERSAANFRDLTNSILRPVPHDQRRIFPLREAVAAVQVEHEELLGMDGIRLKAEVDPDLLVAGSLETACIALSNLIVNAAEERATLISISAEVEHGWVLCQVIDNGPGIPAHLQEKIFELTFTTKPDGTGLGLPLARSVMESAGGMLDFAESRKGHTRFTLRFPKAIKEASYASQTEQDRPDRGR